MREMSRKRTALGLLFIGILVFFLGYTTSLMSDETKWIVVGSLHDWFSSTGSEIEVGRTHLVPDQQDGLRWPAQFNWQDTKAAKALWIGTTNYNDPLANEVFNFKVVEVGPRVVDEENEFMPAEFKLIGRFNHPLVLVDGIPASRLDFFDFVDEVDETLPADRLLYNVVNTSIGITMTRRIYAFSQQNHNNYFVYDYVFKNTGIIDKAGTVVQETLEDVVFFFQYRYAPTRETGPYGNYFLPQSTSWGHSTMNDAVFTHPVTGGPFRSLFSWLGRHSGAEFDNIGGPDGSPGGDGHLGAPHYVGTLVIHADKSATDKSDDPIQPTTTTPVGSDDPWTSANYHSQFNPTNMAREYQVMTAGHPDMTHAEGVGDGFADLFGNTPGGFSQAHGFGPYTLAPGDSIHLVIAEGVAGLGWDSRNEIGATWLAGSSPFVLPNGSTTNDADEYKNEWVYTGRDSLFQTFERARDNYNSGFDIPQPPPPPEQFIINSGGDRIALEWTDNAESWPNFVGYRVYRAIHKPDTTFEQIFECGPGSDNPQVVNQYDDTEARRGFDYYYYIVSYDDGSTNDINPGTPLESSLFYTVSNEPAFLRRAAGEAISDIRVVPNPYNLRAARDLQFGVSAPDRILFVNIPAICTIRIYTERGDLIQTIEHTDGSGDEAWNSVTSSRQVVVSGVYAAVFTTPEGQQAIRKFIIIR